MSRIAEVSLIVTRITVLIVLFVLLMTSSSLANPSDGDYLVGAGDVLKISVYDNQDLETVARVNTDGSIQFPLIGSVKLSGLSVEAATRRIEALLADGYLVNPQVTIFIEEYRSKKVVIIGQVINPGVYELQGPTRLLELISMAGGLRDTAGDELIINRRAKMGGGSPEVIRVDLQQLLETGDSAQNVAIVDADNIFIAKAGMFYVTGEVEKPDAYKLEEGTTVLKAITMAGGFTKLAAKGRVSIVRMVNGQEIVMEKVSMNELLRADDVLMVPESFF